jgi:hypothetical protein
LRDKRLSRQIHRILPGELYQRSAGWLYNY